MTGLVRHLKRSMLVAAPLAMIACSDPAPPPAAPAPKTPPPPAAAPTPAPEAAPAPEAQAAGTPAEQAKEIYTQRCVTCHGAAGVGDGPASAALNPKPRDFQDPEWQKSVTDEHIEKIIKEGGPAVGKSVLMPGNPDLADKPEVITALREMVRGFEKK